MTPLDHGSIRKCNPIDPCAKCAQTILSVEAAKGIRMVHLVEEVQDNYIVSYLALHEAGQKVSTPRILYQDQVEDSSSGATNRQSTVRRSGP